MSWVTLAFVAPMLWAIVFLIDTHLVHSVYEDEYEGAVVVGLFQLLPWVLVFSGVVNLTPLGTKQTVLAFASGVLFLLSIFYYFRALFVLNDATLMQILWNLAVPLVPFLAWVFLGEKLLLSHYVGVGIAFLGALIFGVRQASFQSASKVMPPMFGAVVCAASYMVVSKVAQNEAGNFWGVFFLFTIGAASTSLLLLFVAKKGFAHGMKRLIGMNRKYFAVFLLGEGLSALGVLASQGAIKLSPSVSYVAVIESLVPVFGMVFSFGLVLFFKLTHNPKGEMIYRQQFEGIQGKLLATVLIGGGIYLIT